MSVATTVGIRELKNNLSRYVDEARSGHDVIVTDRGRPVARLSPLSQVEEHLVDLLARGLVTPPTAARAPLPEPLDTSGTVSDLVADQRR